MSGYGSGCVKTHKKSSDLKFTPLSCEKKDKSLILVPTFEHNSINYWLFISTGIGDFTF
jgi:hypothetical protein